MWIKRNLLLSEGGGGGGEEEKVAHIKKLVAFFLN